MRECQGSGERHAVLAGARAYRILVCTLSRIREVPTPLTIWRPIAAALGYPLGVIGYSYTSAMLNLVNPGQRQELSLKARRILRPVYTPRFPYVDLDGVRLRLGSRFPGIPARPIGMALGTTIYLKQDSLDECDLGDMLLLLHELVHVGQYHHSTRIGFACRYGYSIMLHLGNDQNQLEWEAYQFVAANQTAIWQAIRAVCEHRSTGDAGSSDQAGT